ncbi:MAG: enoyl-CoA hydratase/isomerase family protein [Bifidobacteriaceae bacterium]|jgi:naphthoate synthase|nr:enoyl-CoA hydratase/isomerase family protein [Bifidobacteriaceae bacterium]
MTNLPALVSDGFTPELWRDIPGFTGLTDITYHRGVDRDPPATDQPWVRIAFNRPEVRNAFNPHTVDELIAVLRHAAASPDVVAVLLAGNGPSPRDGGYAFCSGGDQRFRGATGYYYSAQSRSPAPTSSAAPTTDAAPQSAPAPPPGAQCGSAPGPTALGDDDAPTPDQPAHQDQSAPAPPEAGPTPAGAAGGEDETASSAGTTPGTGRLHIIEAQHLIRTMPQAVIAVVDGWAAGGGHSLHVVADLTVACRRHGLFKQTDATVGSFDAGYGSALLARQVGQKRAREIFFLAEPYTAEQAEAWGAVNRAVDHEAVESTAIEWASRIAAQSPQAIRFLKFAFNLADDGLAGQQVFAAEATRLAYGTAEGAEGRDAFLERRDPRWAPFRNQIL